jgi:hypothetical protein
MDWNIVMTGSDNFPRALAVVASDIDASYCVFILSLARSLNLEFPIQESCS